LELYNYIINISNIKLHSIVVNNNGEVVSDGYILFKLNVVIEDIDYNDVISFSLCNVDKYYIGFIQEWISKLDYYEENINDIKLLGVFDYFKGIVELLMKYIRDVEVSKYNICLSHNKVCLNTIDYYNPLFICIDDKYKDIVNYVRYKGNIKDIFNYVNVNDLNLMKYIYVYMCFPNMYFDNDLNIDVDKIVEYEKYLLSVEELFDVFIFEHIKRSN
jgi:hypothetical protein